MFGKILVANRGEIACRVMRTARRLGVRTVAVYSDADREALHVRLADEAVRIGPAEARASYLDIEAIVAAAQASGAEAIPPGYGFLSENEDFAAACERAGITFIGPSAASIAAMGDKSAAKRLMEKAGVPLVPGYHGEAQDAKLLLAEAKKIGFPALIKASAGGGGKGMRVVANEAEFAAALEGAKREAASAFGDERVLVERYLARPRHVELQVFWPFTAQVVCIAMLNAETQRGQVLFSAEDYEEEAGASDPVEFVPCADETELLTAFWNVAKHYDSIVTFNGRGFDVPFIYLRSALLNVPISRKDWLGYRYQVDPHCDLAEQLTFYGVSGREGASCSRRSRA